MPGISRAKLIWLSLYVILILAITWGLFRARQDALISLGTEQAHGNWQEWRDVANEQSGGAGPVQRRVPKSDEPPGLVLLRDHFATSWLILAVLTSIVFATLIWMIRGVLLGPKFEPQMDD